ncbi:hypothetical protein MACH23_34720 [Sulfitobacter pontiacus]|nr:hypothetical protein MACH23_34720 [Sulfitobacter pontiacus]
MLHCGGLVYIHGLPEKGFWVSAYYASRLETGVIPNSPSNIEVRPRIYKKDVGMIRLVVIT